MKANEIRFGNLILRVSGDLSESHEQVDSFTVDYLYRNPNTEIFKPIELTTHWLRLLGFEKRDGNNICWDFGDFMIGWYGNKYATWYIEHLRNEKTSEIYSQIKHVHQLQNLYYILTGEELTLVYKNN